MKRLAQVGFWLWFLPCLILVNGYYAIAEYATYVFCAPLHAWNIAAEAADSL